MAFNKGKGTAVAIEISSVYTAIPQVASIDRTGEASETYLARTIDGSAHSAQPPSGYVTNPKIALALFWDSGDTVHTFLKTTMRTPPASTNVKITDVASTPKVEIWPCTGIAVSEKYTTNEGVKADVEFTTSGTPS